MIEIGYTLSSEETTPLELVHLAQRAEEEGFTFALVSDHFHPWIERQGESPFVWSVIGGVAATTERLRLGTGVTCPTTRIHPAIVAQAAATAEAMMPGRFFLGVGTGENLNEHILGDRWPPTEVRQEMLEEALEVIRLLWQGGTQSHYGRYYTVENARIFTLPDPPPPVYVAAAGQTSAELAGRIGDGLISTAPQPGVVDNFHRGKADDDRPCYGQLTVCWADNLDSAKQLAFELWPITALPGELTQELPTPAHFEQVAKMATPDAVASSMPVGPDPAPYVEAVRSYEQSGFTHVYVHQIGHDQEGFFRFWRNEVRPRLDQD